MGASGAPCFAVVTVRLCSSHSAGVEPVADSIVDQGHNGGAFQGVAPRAGVVVRGFGPIHFSAGALHAVHMVLA